MRITVEQERLLKSLQMVERAIGERSALPILANILLEAQENTLVLTATDLDVGVRYRLPLLEPSEQGAVTLPARRFTTIVRELPDETITIEAQKNHTTIVSCGGSRFRVPGLPPEDFPTFPPNEDSHPIVIPQPQLKRLITQTMFAMSLEETRFILNGTFLKAANGHLTLAATDGRRLAVATTTGITHHADGAAMVVPAKTIRELSRLLEDAGEQPVTIRPLKDNQLLFQFDAVTVVSRLLEGQFPQYDSVIPAPSTTTVTCSRQPLTDAIRRASLMTTATSQAVVFEISADRLTISKESPDLGSAQEALPATYTGSGTMTAAFNPEFWLDVLKVLEADDVTIEVSAPDKPAVIRLPRPTSAAQPEPRELVYLVLPMKLS